MKKKYIALLIIVLLMMLTITSCTPNEQEKNIKEDTDMDIDKTVEANLDKLVSIYKDGVDKEKLKNEDAYQNIIKMGDKALAHMLDEFKFGNADGIRGDIMMHACREILGARDIAQKENLSASEWYKKLKQREEVKLDDFKYTGDDEVLKLVYDNLNQSDDYRDYEKEGFLVSGVKVYKVVKEEDYMKVFFHALEGNYKVFKGANSYLVDDIGGSSIPLAMTLKKDDNGEYKLEKIYAPRDGSDYANSIREFCVTPVTNKKIEGLADKLIDTQSDYDFCEDELNKNMKEHLSKNGIEDFILTN